MVQRRVGLKPQEQPQLRLPGALGADGGLEVEAVGGLVVDPDLGRDIGAVAGQAHPLAEGIGEGAEQGGEQRIDRPQLPAAETKSMEAAMRTKAISE